MNALVTLTGDGTFQVPVPSTMQAADLPEDPQLAALLRLRALLGDDVEEQIATRLQLPMALGTEPTDHLLPASLSLLSDTTGDLAPYGWRIGTGLGRSWIEATGRRERLLDAARIALLGYEGPVQTTALGPATLAGATFLASGERTLSDPGAVRDIPMLLGEGLAEHFRVLRDRVPGAQPHLLLREDAVAAVIAGRIPTPSGRRHYPPLPAQEIVTLWRCLLAALTTSGQIPLDDITVGVGADATLLREARSAGLRRFALAPVRLPGLGTATGRALWETIAEAHDAGCTLELVVDPRPGGRMARELELLLETWQQLGHSAADAAGFTLIAHTGGSHAVHAGQVDPSAQPSADELLDEAAIEALLRAAPSWAERVQA